MKKSLLIVLGIFMISTPVKAKEDREYYVEDLSHIYCETGMVMEMKAVSGETMLTLVTANGNAFQYTTKDEDWFLRDFGSMLMDSKGTEDVKDDEIISLDYSGVIWQFEELEKSYE